MQIKIPCFRCDKRFAADLLRAGGAIIRGGKYFCTRKCYSEFFIGEIVSNGGKYVELQAIHLPGAKMPK